MPEEDIPIPAHIQTKISRVVHAYSDEQFQSLHNMLGDLIASDMRKFSGLKPHIHSVQFRVKDPEHLRDKLERRYRQRVKRNLGFDVNAENLTSAINDLIGVRILHLYTHQFGSIDKGLRAFFKSSDYDMVEEPIAKTWDDEYRKYFQSVGVGIEPSASMYTSVHYVIAAESADKRLTCEIQVRTLMEEVWGEVDHLLNYPKAHPSIGIREQLLTLARSTSAATRLVDCIFTCESEFRNMQVSRTQKKRR